MLGALSGVVSNRTATHVQPAMQTLAAADILPFSVIHTLTGFSYMETTLSLL